MPVFQEVACERFHRPRLQELQSGLLSPNLCLVALLACGLQSYRHETAQPNKDTQRKRIDNTAANAAMPDGKATAAAAFSNTATQLSTSCRFGLLFRA